MKLKRVINNLYLIVIASETLDKLEYSADQSRQRAKDRDQRRLIEFLTLIIEDKPDSPANRIDSTWISSRISPCYHEIVEESNLSTKLFFKGTRLVPFTDWFKNWVKPGNTLHASFHLSPLNLSTGIKFFFPKVIYKRAKRLSPLKFPTSRDWETIRYVNVVTKNVLFRAEKTTTCPCFLIRRT